MSGAMAAVIAEGEEVMKWKRGSHAMRRQPFPHGRVHGTRRRKHATAGFVMYMHTTLGGRALGREPDQSGVHVMDQHATKLLASGQTAIGTAAVALSASCNALNLHSTGVCLSAAINECKKGQNSFGWHGHLGRRRQRRWRRQDKGMYLNAWQASLEGW
jgi:hypothetical protein